MAAINPVARPPTDLEQISQAIGIAGGVYGIIDKQKELALQKQAHDQQTLMLQNQLSTEKRKEGQEFHSKYLTLPKGQPGEIEGVSLPPGEQLPEGQGIYLREQQNEANKMGMEQQKFGEEKTKDLRNRYKDSTDKLFTDEVIRDYTGMGNPKDGDALNGSAAYNFVAKANHVINPGGSKLMDFEMDRLTHGNIQGGDYLDKLQETLKGGTGSLDAIQVASIKAAAQTAALGTITQQLKVNDDALAEAKARGLKDFYISPRYEKSFKDISENNKNQSKTNSSPQVATGIPDSLKKAGVTPQDIRNAIKMQMPQTGQQ